ncbi:hypothetical protein CIPAW_04G183600 [Carya illinoinensis]|uniref:Uncharacterized protein n=1 Tax=Carya illinoinensis TaxID=32201 RepID=A0A8T1QW35_CARIL|nr:hypothetical protein CIPAW_04G183600 [Carya illinoinensis]
MESECPGKNSWPELVGAENSNVHATVLLEGTPVTRDFRCDRVRVWVKESGVVYAVPQVG